MGIEPVYDKDGMFYITGPTRTNKLLNIKTEHKELFLY